MAIAQFRIADAARKSARRSVHGRPEWSFEFGLPDVAAKEHPEDSGLLVLIFQFIAVGLLALVVGAKPMGVTRGSP